MKQDHSPTSHLPHAYYNQPTRMSRNNPPTAVPVSQEKDDDDVIVATAMPTEYFEYDDNSNNNNTSEGAPPPVAPTLFSYEDGSPEGQERVVSQKTRMGTDIGKIMAEDEVERIRANNRKVSAIHYHDKQRITTARNVARRRADEANVNFVDPDPSKFENNPNVKQNSSRKVTGEYECSDYDVASYNCTDYDVKEYKSVYS